MDSFDVTALTETWLDDNFKDKELGLEGYKIFRKDRQRKRGGGVVIAVRSCFPCTRRIDLEVDAEMLVCEIGTGGSRCLIFSVFYRPPQSGEDFLDCFESFLDKFSATGVSDLIITGDFNFPH